MYSNFGAVNRCSPVHATPTAEPDAALGDELVGRRCRDDGGLDRTGAAAAIGFDADFEDVAIGGAGDFFEGFAAAGTAALRPPEL
jgi:hypothetical protein